MAEARRPRLLLVTRNLPPLVGGMERLNWHMAEELAKTHDVRIVGPQGSAAIAPAGIPVQEVPLKPLWKFLLAARRQARRVARQWKPDIVLAGSGLTTPIARHAARACSARTVVYVHGLDVAVRHPVYRLLWLPAIRKADRVIANSQPTRQLCIGIGVHPERIGIVHPGVDLPAEAPAGQREDFRMRHGLGNRPLLLSVGRLSARKGLHEFVEHALPLIVDEYPDARLLVIGDAPKDALHAQAQTPESITATADKLGLKQHLLFLGVVSDTVLAEAYRAADVHVFPIRTIAGDPEGFGMVAVEAAAHGLPTVAFSTGGVVDAISDGQSGYLVRPGNYAAFAELTCIAISGQDDMPATCLRFSEQFAWQNFGAGVAGQLNPQLNA